MKPIKLQLKSLLKASSFTVAIVLFPFVGLALEIKDVPNPRQINVTWVTDMARILDQPTQAQINSLGDRRVEIETSYGVKAILPDAKVGKIIATQITPKFKQCDFNGGTLAGRQALAFTLKNTSTINQTSPKITPNIPRDYSVINQSPLTITPNIQTTTLAAQPSDVLERPTRHENVWWRMLPFVFSQIITIFCILKFFQFLALLDLIIKKNEFIQQAIQELKIQQKQRLKKRLIPVIMSTGIIVVSTQWIGWAYTDFYFKFSNVERAWDNVENQIRQRVDIIPNLVSITQFYAQQEQELVFLLVKSREDYLQAVSPNQKAAAIKNVNQAIKRFGDYVAANPQLQSNQRFISLQYKIANTEKQIAIGRMRYNNTVQSYNQEIQQFPNSLLAQAFGFKSQSFFQTTTEN